MGVAAVLYFLRKGVKLHFYSLGTIFEENMRVSRGMQSLGSGFPIGASGIPVGTRLSLGKSSVLYLCFRLTPKRGWLRYLRLGQMGSGQTLFGGSRTGGFCTDTDEIGICSQGKIRLPGKGSKGISTPVPPQRQRPR